MLAVAIVLAVLVVIPWRPLGRAEGPTAGTLVALAALGAFSVLTAPATVYGDGTSHWDHTPHSPSLLGGVLAVVAVAILATARQRAGLLRWGLAIGWIGVLLLTVSQFSYHTPG